MTRRVLNPDGDWVDPNHPSVSPRSAKIRQRIVLAGITVGLVIVLTPFVVRAWMYVPSSQATFDQIKPGMTAEEVESLFRRPPFLDSSKLELALETRQRLEGKENRGWDGPDGLILIHFDANGKVERATFTTRKTPPTVFQWIWARISWS